jgi:hypothetical protein
VTRLVVATVTAVLLGGLATAENRPQAEECAGGVGSWGPGSAYGRLFDPTTIETVRGQVTALDLVNPRKGMACGVCLALATEAGSLAVHLGPESFVRHQDIRIEVGEAVEVTGSRVKFKGKPVIIAVRVSKDDGTLVLRDDRGIPAWSGGRER